VRAAISNGLLRGARLKLWCAGAMFRHERPQRGRYRQFHQVSIEALGFAGADIEAELIAMTARLWRTLPSKRCTFCWISQIGGAGLGVATPTGR